MKKKLLVSSLVILTLTNLNIYTSIPTIDLNPAYSTSYLSREIDSNNGTLYVEIDPEPRASNTTLSDGNDPVSDSDSFNI